MSEIGSVLKGDPRLEKLRWSRRLSLTSRILFVNILPLVLLGGGVIYVDAYRKQLLDERFKLALVEAQITAEALAGASPKRQAKRAPRRKASGRSRAIFNDSFAATSACLVAALRSEPAIFSPAASVRSTRSTSRRSRLVQNAAR